MLIALERKYYTQEISTIAVCYAISSYRRLNPSLIACTKNLTSQLLFLCSCTVEPVTQAALATRKREAIAAEKPFFFNIPQNWAVKPGNVTK